MHICVIEYRRCKTPENPSPHLCFASQQSFGSCVSSLFDAGAFLEQCRAKGVDGGYSIVCRPLSISWVRRDCVERSWEIVAREVMGE